MDGLIAAVSLSAKHTLLKYNRDSIRLVAGLGVDGDAHQGATVKHRSRVARDPSQPNLRQVHLIHAELHEELQAAGFAVAAGQNGREHYDARPRPPRPADRRGSGAARRRSSR